MSQSAKPSIGVFILTKNEAEHIDACLKTCDFFDQIVVVDSESTDHTVSICKASASHVDIFSRPFTNFLDQRQFALSKLHTDWVFYLDADERISDELKTIIQQFVIGATPKKGDMLAIPRRNFLLGKWIAHCGWYPDYQHRLVKKETTFFEEQIVHERLATTGTTIELDWNKDAYITHYTCDDLTSYFQKMNHYTTLEAESYGRNHPFKLTRWGVFSRSFGMFTQTLFHHKGLKDGFPGFIVACIQFMTSFMVMLKCWELQKKRSKNGLA